MTGIEERTGRRRRARTLFRGPGGRLSVNMDCVLVIRRRGDRTEIVHAPRVVDGVAVAAVENFLTVNAGISDNLLHDVELEFPTLSYRDFFVAYSRWRTAERLLAGGTW
jgi:hypothetical protein